MSSSSMEKCPPFQNRVRLSFISSLSFWLARECGHLQRRLCDDSSSHILQDDSGVASAHRCRLGPHDRTLGCFASRLRVQRKHVPPRWYSESMTTMQCTHLDGMNGERNVRLGSSLLRQSKHLHTTTRTAVRNHKQQREKHHTPRHWSLLPECSRKCPEWWARCSRS